MKRKHQNIAEYTRSKRPKICHISLESRWIAATKTKNFMMKDTLSDWLTYKSKKKNSPNNNFTYYNTCNSFQELLFRKGHEFEAQVIKYIHENKFPIVTVSSNINKDSLQRTIDLMNQGVPLIHSAPVINPINKTRGIIDILIRSDYIRKLVIKNPISIEESKIKSPKLKKPYHYIVIDIKYSTLPLKADGIHLLNTGFYRAYKAQCCIYNDAIGYIQGYTPPYSFILGRRWKYKSCNVTYTGYNCLNRLGTIDYNDIDKSFIEKTGHAIKWLRKIENKGDKWSITPPSIPELYPNMKILSDKWFHKKQEISNELGEITAIWGCGVKNRIIGIKNGVCTWKDINCTGNKLGLKGSVAHIVNKIININRENINKITPQIINNNILNWKHPENEIFVDFETMPDIFDNYTQFPYHKPNNMIFLIGVFHFHEDKWNYKKFICSTQSTKQEKKIIQDFYQFLKNKKFPKIWYWKAEKSIWKQFSRKIALYLGHKPQPLQWADLHTVFIKTPIVIKDCFNFRLKNISKALYKHKFIDYNLNTNCKNGTDAIVQALNVYKHSQNTLESPIMKDIITYNKFDCIILYKILEYLRLNHINKSC
jgi:hypothetical protein